MKKIIISSLMCFLFLFSCKKEDSVTPNTSDTITNEVSSHQGIWEATYTGEFDDGVATFTIDSLGNMMGSGFSHVFEDKKFDLVGVVGLEGDLTATFGGEVSTGEEFNGSLTGDDGSGTWYSPDNDLSGTWEAEKQSN